MRGSLEAAFQSTFGYRPMRSFSICAEGVDYERALREAIDTGDCAGIMDADWHARMKREGWCID